MVVPNKFRKTGEQILATYNFQDIADGTGVAVLLLGKESIDGTASYVLDANPFYSDDPEYRFEAGTTIVDYKLKPFNSQRVANGKASLNIAAWTSGTTHLTGLTVRIIRDRASVETNVSAIVAGAIPNGVGAHKMMMIPIPLTRTTFKKDDVLICRVTVTVNAGNPVIGNDPVGRDGTFIDSSLVDPTMTTKSTLFMPFEIDL